MGGVPDGLLAQLHPLEVRLLPHLKDSTITHLAKAAGMQDAEVTRACQWLANKGALEMTPVSDVEFHLGKNGEKALREGMPETRLLDAVKGGATTRDAILAKGVSQEEYGASLGILKKADLVLLGKDGSIRIVEIKAKKHDIAKGTLEFLKRLPMPAGKLSKQDEAILQELKGRKEYIVAKERRDHRITLTDLGKALAKLDTTKLALADKLTPEDLDSGAWKGKTYRAYDVTVPVPKAFGGREHFTEEALEYARKVWIEMGFHEMEGPIVHTAFWDLDALFVPQDHPAREMQDTFYLSNPQTGEIARDVYDRVRAVHEDGARSGSKGWRQPFDKKVSERMLLRTHTTVLSALTLARIREGKLPIPGKYFAMGKCFRNEAVDWKHLFEFNQVEGIVVDPNVNFSQLLGYLKTFFTKMGYPDIRLRPSHFPYTEPSVEIDIFHPVRKEWVEFGGAGVFRPEVTKALLGEDVPVLAWGPGFDRIIVEHFGITDLRDLYKNDLAQLQNAKRFLRLEEKR